MVVSGGRKRVVALSSPSNTGELVPTNSVKRRDGRSYDDSIQS
jgi:hypothetical protein